MIIRPKDPHRYLPFRQTDTLQERLPQGSILALGQVADEASEHRRFFAFDPSMSFLEEGLCQDDPDLFAALPDLRQGETDAMYATPWKLAYTTDGQLPFYAKHHKHGRIRIDQDEHIEVFGQKIAKTSLSHVSLTISKSWRLRQLLLHRTDGPPFQIARENAWLIVFDLTYDYLQLVVETHAMHMCGRHIADALALPYEEAPILTESADHNQKER